MKMETVKKVFYHLPAYNENFEEREKLIDISLSVRIMIYPKYMLVNKT
jgi:hypothetical protein